MINYGYEDTDKKIEISLYGLTFEIKNLNEKKIEELSKIDKDNRNGIEAQLDMILGEGAVEKINNKRIADGHEKMSIDVELNIFGCIFEAYSKEMVQNTVKKVTNAMKDINADVDNVNNNIRNFGNRDQRRYQNRNYNRGYNRRRY